MLKHDKTVMAEGALLSRRTAFYSIDGRRKLLHIRAGECALSLVNDNHSTISPT
jgi:hypothetical protein